MIDAKELNYIKEFAKIFFEKMTVPAERIEAALVEKIELFGDEKEDDKNTVSLTVFLEEPQILIGQGGQTLFEIQRIMRMALNKKLQKVFYLDLDINEYKSKKVQYLKNFAKELADQVTITKEPKILNPMPAYERRIIHQELSRRTDIVSESSGEGPSRHIIIKPKS